MKRSLVTSLAALCVAGVMITAAGAAGAGPDQGHAATSSVKRGFHSTALARPVADKARAATHRREFPVELKTTYGLVRIPSRPTRILSLSASATQMIYAVGAGHQVIGVDKYSTYPPNAPRTSFTGYETSAEDYLRLRPDLVVLAFDQSNMVSQLALLHIPALVEPAASTLASANQQMVQLGVATGHASQARAEVALLDRKMTAIVAKAHGNGHNKTYYIELDPTLYSATSDTFIGAVFARFGMRDIANAAGHGSQYPQLSAEYLLKANPDYAFLADTICCGQNERTFAERPGFSNLRAVRLGHVIDVNDSYASEWGPHSLVTFANIIARVLDAKVHKQRATTSKR